MDSIPVESNSKRWRPTKYAGSEGLLRTYHHLPIPLNTKSVHPAEAEIALKLVLAWDLIGSLEPSTRMSTWKLGPIDQQWMVSKRASPSPPATVLVEGTASAC